jgi:hypothetical protein
MHNSSVISQPTLLTLSETNWHLLNSAQKPAEFKIILYLELRIIVTRKANCRSSDGGTALAANLVKNYTEPTLWFELY